MLVFLRNFICVLFICTYIVLLFVSNKKAVEYGGCRGMDGHSQTAKMGVAVNSKDDDYLVNDNGHIIIIISMFINIIRYTFIDDD